MARVKWVVKEALLRGIERCFQGFGPNESRWIVLDLESSGENPTKDRLLSIAASAIHFGPTGKPTQDFSDSFEVRIQQPSHLIDSSNKINILEHGIGVSEQKRGMPAGQALARFLEYVNQSPIISFQSEFSKTLLNRFLCAELGQKLHNHWVDLGRLAAGLHQESHPLSLDVWLRRYGVASAAGRQDPVSDVLAMAQLFLRLWPLLQQRDAITWRAMVNQQSKPLQVAEQDLMF